MVLAREATEHGAPSAASASLQPRRRSLTTVIVALAAAALLGVSFLWTAGAADWLSFRYPILHDDTVTDELIAWWDYGSALTLCNGETFSAKFNNAAVGVAGTIFSLT